MRFLPLTIFLTFLAQNIAVGEMEMTFEVFSIPISKAAKLKRENLAGEESHRRLLDLTEKGDARLKVWMTAKIRLGQTTTLEEIKEVIYPTEMELLQIPSMVGTGFGEQFPPPPIPVPKTATSYDTKKTGNTLELELGKAGRTLRLQLRFTKAKLIQLDEYGKGIGRVKMPRFAVQRFNITATVMPGKPALLGTISPPPDLQKNEGKRVWLAFVTVSKSQD